MKWTWTILFYVSRIVHYSFGYIAYQCLKFLGIGNMAINIALIFILWVIVVLSVKGCPFSYFDEWILIKAGRICRKSYGFKDCILYKYGIHPIKRVVKRGSW